MTDQGQEPVQAAIETPEAEAPAPEGSADLETQQAEGQQTETAENDGEHQEEGKKSRGGFQQRIDRLTREKYEAARRAQQLEQRLVELEQRVQPEQPQLNIPEDNLPPMPTPEQFDFDDNAYQAAVREWADLRATAAQQAVMSQIEQQQQVEQAMKQQAEMAKKVEVATEKYPDFVERISDPNLPNLQEVNPAAFEAVISSDKMADVAYYLANNPQEVYDLMGVHPVDAIRRIALIEAKFSGQAARPAAAAPTNPPPATVQGTGTPDTSLENVDDINEWMQRRWEQLNS